MSNLSVVYTPRPDATPEGELNALANAYSFILQCAEERKKGGPAAALDSAKGGSSVSSAKAIIPK